MDQTQTYSRQSSFVPSKRGFYKSYSHSRAVSGMSNNLEARDVRVEQTPHASNGDDGKRKLNWNQYCDKWNDYVFGNQPNLVIAGMTKPSGNSNDASVGSDVQEPVVASSVSSETQRNSNYSDRSHFRGRGRGRRPWRGNQGYNPGYRGPPRQYVQPQYRQQMSHGEEYFCQCPSCVYTGFPVPLDVNGMPMGPGYGVPVIFDPNFGYSPMPQILNGPCLLPSPLMTMPLQVGDYPYEQQLARMDQQSPPVSGVWNNQRTPERKMSGLTPINPPSSEALTMLRPPAIGQNLSGSNSGTKQQISHLRGIDFVQNRAYNGGLVPMVPRYVAAQPHIANSAFEEDFNRLGLTDGQVSPQQHFRIN